MAQIPIEFNEIASLSSAPISIQPEYVKRGTCTMDSERFVVVCETKRSQIAITELSAGFAVTRHKVSAEEAIMNPESNIIAFRVGKILQMFDLDEHAVVKSYNSHDQVIYWRWATPNCLTFVTSASVFHWALDKDSPPVKIFDRHPTLTQKRTTITNYQVSGDKKWCLLCSTHFVKATGVLEGFMQLYSVDGAVSQILQGHAGAFAVMNLPNRNAPAQVVFVEHKVNTESAPKLHIQEVGYDQATNGGERFRADPGVIPTFTDAPNDYPVSMIVALKSHLLYMVTKMGVVHVYDGVVGSLLCSARVTTNDLLCTTAHAASGGICVITNLGKVLLVSVNLDLLVPYIEREVKDKPLAMNVAFRLDLPGAEPLFSSHFDTLLTAGDVDAAVAVAVSSPRDCMRTSVTVERLKQLSAGNYLPLFQYLSLLIAKGKLDQLESIEFGKLATDPSRTNLLQTSFSEDKLTVTVELVEELMRDPYLAISVSQALGAEADDTMIDYFFTQKQYDNLLTFARLPQCKVDYVVLFERCVRIDPEGAVAFAKLLASAKLIDPSVVVDKFVKSYKRSDATLFLKEVLLTNRSDQGALQTKLLELYLWNSWRNVAEVDLAFKKYTYFDKPHIAQLCEKAGMASRALELYTEVADIKRVLLAHAAKLHPSLLPSSIGRLPPNELMEVMTIVLKQDPVKNLKIIARIAVNFKDVLDVKDVISLFEECAVHEAMFEYLGAIVNASKDPEVHLKYIQAAVHMQQYNEVLRVCKESTVFDPAAVVSFLYKAKLPSPAPLMHVCDRFGYVDKMTTYLCIHKLENEVEKYVLVCSAPNTLQVLGKLMDLKCSNTFICKVIDLVSRCVAINEIIQLAESRNNLCALRSCLESIIERHNVDPIVHNAMAKINIMLNNKPLQFLHSNPYYDSLVVGNFCEKSHPHLACAAYARANGKCDVQLLKVAQENNVYQDLARYLMRSQDMVLWQKALIPEGFTQGDPTPDSRRNLVDAVLHVLPEVQEIKEIFTTANAYTHCHMVDEKIQLLERVVSQGSKFAKDPHLQTLLIRTAIQYKKEKVMGYINGLGHFDGRAIAEVAVKPENALYEEAFAIYLKLSQNIWSVDRTRFCIAAVDVLINHLGDLDRAREFAQLVNVKDVHSKVLQAQNQALRAPPLMKGVPVQPAPPSPHTPPVPPAPPVGADVPNSWLAVRLLANGFDLALVKDCDQKLVVKEGFISEHDFADCPPNEFDAAYLSSVGISAKGIQRHLIRLQGELHGASKGTSPVPPTQLDSTVPVSPAGFASPTKPDKPLLAQVEILQGQTGPDDSSCDPEFCPSVPIDAIQITYGHNESEDSKDDPMLVPKRSANL